MAVGLLLVKLKLMFLENKKMARRITLQAIKGRGWSVFTAIQPRL